jgi:hypothetical protein
MCHNLEKLSRDGFFIVGFIREDGFAENHISNINHNMMLSEIKKSFEWYYEKYNNLLNQ